MSLSIGVATGFEWLGSPGRHFFDRRISTYFDNDENLTHLCPGLVKSMLAEYAEEDSPTDEQLATARAFSERLSAYWQSRGWAEWDIHTVQVEF